MSFNIPNLLPDFSLGANVFDLGQPDRADLPNTQVAVQAPQSASVNEASVAAGTTAVSQAQTSQESSIFPLFRGLAALPLQFIHGAQWLLSTAPDAVQKDAPLSAASAAPAPPLYQRNLAKIEQLLDEIESVLRHLDRELQSRDPRHQPVMPSSLRLLPAQTGSQYARSWGYSLRGAASAASSATGWAAVAAGLPYVVGLTGNFLAQMAAVFGGSYIGLSTLRDLPDQARQNAANLAIQDAMQEVEKLQRDLEPLIQQETIRKNAMDRIISVAAERQHRVRALENKLVALENAILSARAVPYPNIAGLSIDALHVGDGEQREQSLSMLASARQAFQEFLSTVNTGLAVAANSVCRPLDSAAAALGQGLSTVGRTIHRVIATPGALLDRYNAYQAEIAYQNGEGKSLFWAPTMANQLRTGEKIARALYTSDDPTPGAVALPGVRQPTTATANLTTARALAWYLDTAATFSAETARDAAAPTVRRLPDDSLLISDANGHFYDFLMHAPTAYTVSMVDATVHHDTVMPGVFQLHDYYAGFPGGNRGIQFERIVDENTGTFALHMRFVNEHATFGIQPAIISLRNDDHIVNRAYTSKRIHQAQHSILTADEFENMSIDDLAIARASVIAELGRHIKLAQGERQQLEQLKNWEHPSFKPLLV